MSLPGLKITPPPDAAPHAAPHDPPNTLGSWLGVMVSMIRAPEPERRAVRQELESHLRERVRDLMLAGTSEADAERCAIAELGDAAELARRYQDALSSTTRRKLMNVTAIAVAGLALSVSTVVGLRAVQPPAPAATPIAAAPSAPALRTKGNLLLDQFVSAAPNSPVPNAAPPADNQGLIDVKGSLSLDEFAAVAAASLQLQPLVRWDRFASTTINQDTRVAVPAGRWSVAKLASLMNESLDRKIAYRTDDGMFSLAPEDYFDHAEQTLLTYDVAAIVESRTASGNPAPAPDSVMNDITQLITQLVCPDGWRENGGDLAVCTRFGTKLFIQAPKRYHEQIAWLLGEMHAKPRAGAVELRRQNSVPLLRDLPIINRGFISSELVAQGPGEYTITPGEHGGVKIQGPSGTLEAAEFKIIRHEDAEADPTRTTQVIRLRYAPASEVAELLRSRYLEGTVRLIANDATNSIVVESPADAQEGLQHLINRLDSVAPSEPGAAPAPKP